MKILILHQHFNTPQEGGALRSYYLATGLVAHGLHPIVITAHNEKSYKSVILEGIVIHYLPVAYANRFGFWQRIVSFLRYVVAVWQLMPRMPQVSVCYAISVPLTVGLAARGIRFWYKIPYLFEVGDLWPDAPIALGFIRNPWLKWLLYRLERSIYNGSRGVVALSGAIKSEVERRTPGTPVWLIPNMADTDYYQLEGRNPALAKEFGVEGKFVVSYVGAVGFANGLDYFVACAHASQQANLAAHFLVCGDGAKLAEIKQQALTLGVTNISFIPFTDRAGVREVMRVTDAAFVCYRPSPILETGSPNKYFDGLASGKLIILNFGGWIRAEVEAHACGVYVDPRNPRDFVKQVEPFVSNPDALRQCQRRSRQLAEERYSRRQLTETFVSLTRTFSH